MEQPTLCKGGKLNQFEVEETNLAISTAFTGGLVSKAHALSIPISFCVL